MLAAKDANNMDVPSAFRAAERDNVLRLAVVISLGERLL